MWYSLSVNVCDGATTIESPVWIPTGSIFSILQTTIAVSLLSRITSYSISLYPEIDFSNKHWVTGEYLSPFVTMSSSSSSLWQIPPPVPPIVKAGRTITGYPIFSTNLRASSKLWIISDSGTGSPSSFIKSLNSSLSSACLIESSLVPSSSTPHSSSTPASCSSTARFSPTCPPRVGSKASGRSFLIIFDTNSTVNGSIYTLSAISLSVIIVAGLEFTRITLYPSSRNDKHACVPA